jgi:lipopolysaccharide/colanic/teichoic acid biosynthesis glycosyltransferase
MSGYLNMEGRTFYERWGKRAFDIVASGLGLLVLSPVFLLCALLVRLTSPGPIFFRQIRVGRRGRHFTILKFRTLRHGANSADSLLVAPDDKRLTRCGSWLRRFKLDELPQLINVLLGDMSLVGPRPRIPELVDLDCPEDQRLLSVRPGLTSYASIHHHMEATYFTEQGNAEASYRDNLIPQKRLLDGEYAKSCTFALDLKLIFLTLLVLFAPGKAEPRTARVFGLEVSAYGRLSQLLLDVLVFGGSVWLAYWLRFEGHVSGFFLGQRNAFIILIPATRLMANLVFGVYDMIWRYWNLIDGVLIAVSLSAVTAVLFLLRLLLPPDTITAHVFQLPLGVIATEYLLVLAGCLGMRALRRLLYEMNHRYKPLPTAQKRRVLILGAGLSGVGVALEIARYPHFELLGFIDDDTAKQGRLIAGFEILGTSEKVGELLRRHRVSDLIVCAPALSSVEIQALRGRCEDTGTRIHIIPTIDQILEFDVGTPALKPDHNGVAAPTPGK